MIERDQDLVLERAHEPDDDAIRQAVAILLREDTGEGEGRAA